MPYETLLVERSGPSAEMTLGMPFMWEANTRLINLVGMGKAKEIVMTGAIVTAEDALSIGLVNQVVHLDKLQEVTRSRSRTRGIPNHNR